MAVMAIFRIHMTASFILKPTARVFVCGFLLLCYYSSFTACAAERKLGTNTVPAVVARGLITPQGRVPGTNRLHLALGLPLRNASALTNLLAAIYNPASPEFHHYLKPAEFAARFGPLPTDYAAIIHFAKTNGLTVTATHRSRLLVDVSGRAADVERAFHVQLNRYQHPTESRSFYAPDSEPTVDAALPLLSVSGLDNFALPHPNVQLRPNSALAKVFPNGGSSPYGSYMGGDFRKAYLPGTTLTGAGQNIGLLQYDGFYPIDITNYETAIGLTSNVPQIVVVPVDGGVTTPGDGDAEVSLDIEMVMSMSPGVSNIYVYEAPSDTSLWVDVLAQMAEDDAANQLSCSWAGGSPQPLAEEIFQVMAAQGQSFFNASGDSAAVTGVFPFPCDSPNITIVGGTTLTTDTNGNYGSETVWNTGADLGSSGGVSTFPIPIWQLGLNPEAAGGSTTLRNLPDVALTADNVYLKYGNGLTANAVGTSCASPLWAAVTALLNQQAAQLGQPPVGFLNPTLYAIARGTNYPTVFHDIVTGNNTNSSSPANYFASVGYDLCTGLGSPNGTNFINAVNTLDPLGLLPATAFTISGPVSGPFTATNQLILLTNGSGTSLNWALGTSASWMTASPTSGTLTGFGTTAVNLALQNVRSLPAGDYVDVLEFTNKSLNRVQVAELSLLVGESIVVNGGFETGDFTGWTLVGDTIIGDSVFNVVATDFDFPDLVHSGNYGAFLGEGGYAATLSQTLATIPGQKYLVSCWLDNPVSGATQTFSAAWDGTNYVSLINPPAFTWSNFQFTVVATLTNTVLQFAAENDPNYFGFDDVSVTPVPAVAFAGFAANSNTFQLGWNSLAGLNYQVQFKTNLAQPAWQNLSTMTAVTNTAYLVDTNANNAQRFYRLELLP